MKTYEEWREEAEEREVALFVEWFKSQYHYTPKLVNAEETMLIGWLARAEISAESAKRQI